MKCPFKKITRTYTNESYEEFGYCNSDCVASFTKPDGTLGCALVEKRKFLEEYLDEVHKAVNQN